jgi:hypothetical protein
MSLSRAEVTAMDEDELVDAVVQLSERVDELEERVEKNGNKPGYIDINLILDALTGEEIPDYTEPPVEYKDTVGEFGDLVQSMNQRLNTVEEIADEEQSLSGDPSVKNWQAIVEKAENLQGHADHQASGNTVKLFVKQIMGAVGCSDTWASELIEQYGAGPNEDTKGKRGTDWQPHKKMTTSRQTESSNVQRKALYVDLDVWGDD